VSLESAQDPRNEQAIARMMINRGGDVKTATTGAVTCTTIVPPPSMSEYGYDSICKISGNGREVAVQASTRDRNARVPVGPLRQLVMLAEHRLAGAGR
jgi:hypothetical protein